MVRGDTWWTSWDEVPQVVLDYPYNDKEKIRARDPDYLRNLNEKHNPRPHPKKTKAFVYNGEGKTILCAGAYCRSTIRDEDRKKGKRLCDLCEDKIRHLGQVGHIRYSGGDDGLRLDNNLHS